jgi:hypothetical protein
MTYRLWIWPILFGCLAAIIAALIGSGTSVISQWQSLNHNIDLTLLLGRRPYTQRVVIESIDLSNRLFTVKVPSALTNQALIQRLQISSSFRAERQDPIIIDGVMTGLKFKKEISLADLKPGMNGIAIVGETNNGSIYIDYLKIGDPFPRP